MQPILIRIVVIFTTLIFLTSCAQRIARLEYGYGESIAMGDLMLRGSGEPIEGHFISPAVGMQVWEENSWSVDFFIGAWIFVPSRHESAMGLGPFMSPRLTYDLGVKPFVFADLGLGFANWDVQGSNFGFIIGGGPGIMVPLSDRLSFLSSWKLFHFSNASTSDPNPGINTDLLTIGLEWRF
jgi:hypothetical protein